MQGVLLSPTINLEYSDVSREEEVQDTVQEMQQFNFDISNGQSLRLRVLRFTDTVHRLILGYHHLYLDGISHQIYIE